jgi:hypothetical protein
MVGSTSKKRKSSSNQSENLSGAFDNEIVKRIRVHHHERELDDKITTSNSTHSHTFRAIKPSPLALRYPPFSKCHFLILQSLYNNQDIEDSLWQQIDLFLAHRGSLLANNNCLKELSELVAESKSILEKPPLSAPLRRMNTSLKSETKLSFSFVTQSQQLKVQSLSLNSPVAIGMIKHETTSPFYKSFMGSVTLRGAASMRKHTCNANQEQKVFNSMNLVTSLLLKKYQVHVEKAKKEREPFLPLLHYVKGHIETLEQEIKEMNRNMEKECDLREMSQEEIFDLLANARVNHVWIGNDMSNANADNLSMKKSRLALWSALELSLENVIMEPTISSIIQKIEGQNYYWLHETK